MKTLSAARSPPSTSTMREFRLLELPLPRRCASCCYLGPPPPRPPHDFKSWPAQPALGWTHEPIVTLPPVAFERAHLHRALKNVPRRGRRIAVVALTKTGKKFMKDVVPRHSKLVKALLRVLHIREQDTLVRICLKLRQGDILKFVHEIRMQDDE